MNLKLPATKILASLRTNEYGVDFYERLILAGATLFRYNFSFVDLEEHELPKIYSDLAAAISSTVVVGIVDDGRRILVNARHVGVNELMDTIRALTRNRYKHKNIYKEQRDHSFKLH